VSTALSSIYSPEYQQLLARLKEARVNAGLTQAQAARALDKPQSYVSKCESGERRIDPIELRHFARLYCRPITFFFPDCG
jgi:transcriptional regulator with XRE-family HTH domain